MTGLYICTALLLVLALQQGALVAAVVDDGFPYCRGIDSICRGKAAPIDGSSVLPDQDLYLGTVSVPQIGYQGVRPDTSDYATPVASFHNGQLVRKLSMAYNSAGGKDFLGHVELTYTDGYVEKIGADKVDNTDDAKEYHFQPNELITAIRIWSKEAGKESDNKYNYFGGGSGNPFPYVSKIQFDTSVRPNGAFEWCVIDGDHCGDDSSIPLRTLTDLGSGLLAGVHGKFRYNYVAYVPTAFTAIGFYFAGPVVKSTLLDVTLPYLGAADPPQGKTIIQTIRRNEGGIDNESIEMTTSVTQNDTHTYSITDTSTAEFGFSTGIAFKVALSGFNQEAGISNSEKFEGKWTTSDSTTTSDTQTSASTYSVRFTFPPAPAGKCVMYLARQGGGQLTTLYNGNLSYTIQNPNVPAKNMSIDTTGQYFGDLTSAVQTQAFIVDCPGATTAGPVLLAEDPGLQAKMQILKADNFTFLDNKTQAIKVPEEVFQASAIAEAPSNSTVNNMTATMIALQQQGSSSAADSDGYPFCNRFSSGYYEYICRGKAINKEKNTANLLALDPDLYIDTGRQPTRGYQTNLPNTADYGIPMAAFRNGQLVRTISMGYSSAGESDFLGYIVITYTDNSTERIGAVDKDSNRLVEYTFKPNELITAVRVWTKAAGKESDSGANNADPNGPYIYVSKIRFDTNLNGVFEWCVIKGDTCDAGSDKPLHTFTELGSGLLAGLHGTFRHNIKADVNTAFTSIGFYFAGLVVDSNLADVAFPYLDDAIPPQANTIAQIYRNNTLGLDSGIVETTGTVSESSSHTYTLAQTKTSQTSVSVTLGLFLDFDVKAKSGNAGDLTFGYNSKWTESKSTTTSDTQTSAKTTAIKLSFPPAPVGQCVSYLVFQGSGKLTTLYRGSLIYTIQNPARNASILSIDTTGQYVGKLTSAIQSQSFNCTDKAAGNATAVTDPALQIGTQDLGITNQTCTGACSQQLNTPSRPFRLAIPQLADTPAINNEAATLNTNLGGGAFGQNSFGGLG